MRNLADISTFLSIQNSRLYTSNATMPGMDPQKERSMHGTSSTGSPTIPSAANPTPTTPMPKPEAPKPGQSYVAAYGDMKINPNASYSTFTAGEPIDPKAGYAKPKTGYDIGAGSAGYANKTVSTEDQNYVELVKQQDKLFQDAAGFYRSSVQPAMKAVVTSANKMITAGKMLDKITAHMKDPAVKQAIQQINPQATESIKTAMQYGSVLKNPVLMKIGSKR